MLLSRTFKKTSRRRPSPALVAAAFALALMAQPPQVAAAASPSSDAPFARVYLAIRGCTSCSHCRTSIRQMVRSSAQGGEARVRDDRVEVRYGTPRAIPLREVIRSLAENRLHDLSLVDVLFNAQGAIRTARDGSTAFHLEKTGQAFPVSLDRSVRRPPDGTPFRLTALVEGWRGKRTLSLTARTIEAAN